MMEIFRKSSIINMCELFEGKNYYDGNFREKLIFFHMLIRLYLRRKDVKKIRKQKKF